MTEGSERFEKLKKDVRDGNSHRFFVRDTSVMDKQRPSWSYDCETEDGAVLVAMVLEICFGVFIAQATLARDIAGQKGGMFLLNLVEEVIAAQYDYASQNPDHALTNAMLQTETIETAVGEPIPIPPC